MSFQSIGLNMHPLYMMMSVCIACSFAFMLPVATPPNAIVFSTGYLKIYDMVCMNLHFCFRFNPLNRIIIVIKTLTSNLVRTTRF